MELRHNGSKRSEFFLNQGDNHTQISHILFKVAHASLTCPIENIPLEVFSYFSAKR